MTPNLMHYLRYILCAFLVDIGMTETELDSSLWSPKTNLMTLQSWLSQILWKIQSFFKYVNDYQWSWLFAFCNCKTQFWCWCKLYPQEMLDILQPFCAPCYCSYWLIGWQCNYCPRYDITICPGRTRNKGWLVARIKIRYYVHNNKYSESFGQYLVIFIVRVLNCCLNIVPLKHSSSLVDLAYWQFQICQRQKWLLCLLTWMLAWA